MSTMFTSTLQCLKITQKQSRKMWLSDWFQTLCLLPRTTRVNFGRAKNLFWLNSQDRKWQYT